jgi:hypothetical protein
MVADAGGDYCRFSHNITIVSITIIHLDHAVRSHGYEREEGREHPPLLSSTTPTIIIFISSVIIVTVGCIFVIATLRRGEIISISTSQRFDAAARSP